MTDPQPKVYVIHENEAWVEPLFGFFKAQKIPFENWFVNEGMLNLSDIPPEGVFYNRMSASSHTRDHRYAIEFSESLLAWLELHDRKVVNSRKALSLEVRKTEQQMALNRFGIETPRTILANNDEDVVKAAEALDLTPFIVKPNRGGKGLGVKKYNTTDQLRKDLEAGTAPVSLDGVLLVQEYIKPADGRIVRAEFIGGKFYYAVSVDASGGFELCPADVCNIGDDFCPVTQSSEDPADSKFKIIENFNNSDIDKYEQFLEASGISIGAIEFIVDTDGRRVVYDVNTNTNYNSDAEASLNNQYQGMRRIAEFLDISLSQLKSSNLKLAV